MVKFSIRIALLMSFFTAAPLVPAEAQSLPSRTIRLSCARSVTPQTTLALKTRLLAEPFTCAFQYKVVRFGRTISSGELTVAIPANSASSSVVRPVSGAQSFDVVEVVSFGHWTALPIDKAWVGGRCRPIQNQYPKQSVSVTSSPFVGVYHHQASLEERFSCK